jgi:sugar lactone lactonase YvrE
MADVRIIPRERRDQLGEGVTWSGRDGSVYWVDILGQVVSRLHLATDRVDSWAMPDMIGWLVERERGGFVAGLGRAFVSLSLDPLSIETIAAPEPKHEGNRFNDGKADAAGRIWAGSMHLSGARPSGAFYRLDPDGRATRVEDDYTIPNGPAVGNGYLLHADTALNTVFRYTVHEDGSLGPRVPHIVFESGWGSPDGMTLDAEDHLWVACWGASCVARFDPEGRRQRTIAFPASQISNVTFAGDALDRMFVTSAADGVDEAHAGCLFEVDPACRGVAPFQYRG